MSGAEYLLLGILLGPQVSRILSPSAIESFAPITSLGLGWMGALLGSRLLLSRLVRTPGVLYRVAMVEAFLTLTCVSGVMTFVVHLHFGIALDQAWVPAIALGAIATMSSQSAIAVVSARTQGREAVIRQLQIATTLSSVVGVLVFALLLAAVHPTPSQLGRSLTTTEWMVLTLSIGVIGGALFHLFLGDQQHDDRLFIALTGAVILVSGSAMYLRLSPIAAGLCFGAVLTNTTRARAAVTLALTRVERPLYFALLIFAGAAWRPSSRAWVLPVFLFVVLRLASRIGSARLAARWNDAMTSVGANWGRGLLGQGGLGLAVALNYTYQDTVVASNVVFTAAVASVLLTDLLSARFVTSLLPSLLSADAAPRGGSVVPISEETHNAAAGRH